MLLLLRACGQAKKHEEEARYVELRERTTKTEETLAQESKRRQEAVRAVQTVCDISASGRACSPDPSNHQETGHCCNTHVRFGGDTDH